MCSSDLLQSPDFAGAGAGSVQLLLGLPQGGQAALLCLWFFRFGFRPAIKPSHAGFDFFQQLVVGGDLPIYFALVGADTALFHLAGGWPHMDRGNLINALVGSEAAETGNRVFVLSEWIGYLYLAGVVVLLVRSAVHRLLKSFSPPTATRYLL